MKRKPMGPMDRALLPEDFEPECDYAASREKAYDRKTDQLCAQVQQALGFLLETESTDESLQGFYVAAVTPYPNASRLLIELQQWDRNRSLDLKTVLAHLAEAKTYWRLEVGRATNRKKTPDLMFQVLLAGGEA